MTGGVSRWRRRLNRWLTPFLRWCHSLSNTLAHTWRRSLQLRVVVSTLSLSLIVIVILGVVLTSQITDRLLEAKITAATEEMDRARGVVEDQLAGVDGSAAQRPTRECGVKLDEPQSIGRSSIGFRGHFRSRADRRARRAPRSGICRTGGPDPRKLA